MILKQNLKVNFMNLYMVENIYPTAVYTRLISLLAQKTVVYASSGISLMYMSW